MRHLFCILLILCAANLSAQNTAYTIDIEQVGVVAHRPIRELGMQKSLIDSTALRDNIALSLSDVLTYNSSIFIKQYGRATLSTASFRGTSPSHTQVTWNGMRLNSPMLGMTDFSMIPSYFIDEASLLHGSSSISASGGGLGGAISLSTSSQVEKGWGVQAVQGIGSYSTFDEFLRLSYGGELLKSSTRVAYSTSKNNFRYTNYDKKENIYDSEHNIIGKYHPEERNRSGDFKDLNILQELFYDSRAGDKFSLSAWYTHSRRGVPMTSVSYAEEDYLNRQNEDTFRGVIGWQRLLENFKLSASAGYLSSRLNYYYSRDVGGGNIARMIDSRSRVNTLYGNFSAEYYLGQKWLLTADVKLHQHFVRSQDMNIIQQDGERALIGYDKARIELSGFLSAKWRATERLSLSLALREELYGEEFSPLIPAFFADWLISERGEVVLKASASRNFRFPTLNDLYFQPGGNPDLRKERGMTYDLGVDFRLAQGEKYSLSGGVNGFDSRVDDWILWLPSVKGFWSPRNIKRVHSYGAEGKLSLKWRISQDWNLSASTNASWTPSINEAEPVGEDDASVGKQLPYVPRFSASATALLSWRSWRVGYRWAHYSERFTMSSNDRTLTGVLVPYYMNDVHLERLLSFRWADCSLKVQVNNLFNEEYVSVLSRPMPRRNYELFISIKPKW